MTGAGDKAAVDADLCAARFRAGVMQNRWRLVSFEFPVLILAVTANQSDGTSGEYTFRFEVTRYPTVAPEVIIWDVPTGQKLMEKLRPKGSRRVMEAFKDWTVPHSVYRPWDRHGLAHGNWAHVHPDLAWSANRDLSFILEDLHGLLNSSPRAHGPERAA